MLVAVICHHLQLSSRLFHSFISVFFCIFSCNNGCILADEIPTGFVKLLYSPTFTNISKFSGNNVVFCSKNFFRCSGSSNFSFLLCYSEWEFFLLQGFRDFSNKYDKVSGQFLFFEICQRQQNLKNEKCNTFSSACYSSNLLFLVIIVF